MGGLVIRAPAGIQSFTGSQYVSPANGTRRLCVRTGTGINDIVKYGLTSDTSASSYCCMRLRMDGQMAMIGRSETFTSSSSSNWTVASSSRQTGTYATYTYSGSYTYSGTTYSTSKVGPYSTSYSTLWQSCGTTTAGAQAIQTYYHPAGSTSSFKSGNPQYVYWTSKSTGKPPGASNYSEIYRYTTYGTTVYTSSSRTTSGSFSYPAHYTSTASNRYTGGGGTYTTSAPCTVSSSSSTKQTKTSNNINM